MISTKETQVEVLINRRLENLKWNLDHRDPAYNVAKQNVKTKEEKDALEGKVPDYVLYDQNNKPLIIIEAKKPHKDLKKAIDQGIKYATKLKAPIVFATDGIFTKSYHVNYKKPLYLNKEELDDFIPQAIAIKYTDKNEHFTEDESVIKSKSELIPIFKQLNNKFFQAGIEKGRPRIELFCNFLFLKLISELSDQEDSMIKPIPSWANWKNFTKKNRGEELFNFINHTAYNHFKKAYGGEVLSPIKINAGKYNVLNEIVASLEGLVLHSIDTDIKGDAFEFFLRNYGGAETDFGEYFTPRHIVKALVKILNPQIGEKVYDPFCGTGGMLTYSYKHIYNYMAKTEEHKKSLKEKTVYGGELTDMSRVAKMNMILAGDGHSNILQQDSYATPQRGKYDVVITNMPFGSKMKTPYAKQYGYNTLKAEIVGVLHCLDALNDNENARAGILVPEGILFNGTKAYTSLREQLTEQYTLENIISLPSGVFGKNTGVRSNILIIKKHPQKQKNHIWYFKVQNDGYTLDAHRRKIEGTNDIDIVSSEKELRIENKSHLEKLGFNLLYKDKIKQNNYILSPGDYQTFQFHTKYEMVGLGSVCTIVNGYAFKSKHYTTTGIKLIRINNVQQGYINESNFQFYTPNSKEKVDKFLLQENDLLVSLTGNIGRVGFVNKHLLPALLNQRVGRIRVSDGRILKAKYLFYILNSFLFINWCKKNSKGIAQNNLSTNKLENFQIPLPPLKAQKALIEELESYQTIIQSAEKIIKSWKPFFKVDSSWEVVKLGDLFDTQYGITTTSFVKGGVRLLRITDIGKSGSLKSKGVYVSIASENLKKYKLEKNDILIARTGTIGRMYLCDNTITPTVYASYLVRLKLKKEAQEKILPQYVFYQSKSIAYNHQVVKLATTNLQPNLNAEKMKLIQVPIPPLPIQKKIVAQLEAERALIEVQKKVIATFENKMQSTLNTIWQQ